MFYQFNDSLNILTLFANLIWMRFLGSGSGFSCRRDPDTESWIHFTSIQTRNPVTMLLIRIHRKNVDFRILFDKKNRFSKYINVLDNGKGCVIWIQGYILCKKYGLRHMGSGVVAGGKEYKMKVYGENKDEGKEKTG